MPTPDVPRGLPPHLVQILRRRLSQIAREDPPPEKVDDVLALLVADLYRLRAAVDEVPELLHDLATDALRHRRVEERRAAAERDRMMRAMAGKPPTSKQLHVLEKLGVAGHPENRAEASRLIDQALDGRDLGDALAARRHRTMERARALLRGLLEDGPRPSSEVHDAFREAEEVTHGQLGGAKRALGVESHRQDGRWHMRLPGHDLGNGGDGQHPPEGGGIRRRG